MGKKRVIIKETPVIIGENNKLEETSEEPSEKQLKSVFSTVLVFSIAMFTLPILTYFLAKSYIFEGFFNYDNNTCTIYSAILAVIMVHIIIGLFIYTAWNDAMDKKKED